MAEPLIHIVIVDPNRVRASIIEEGLREAGYGHVTVISDMRELLRQIVDAEPDVIFIDLENPNRDVLEQMFQVSRNVHRPIAMFVDRSDTPSIEAAFDAGVSAYIVDGLRKERVKPLLDVTISRFNAFNKLRDELGHHPAGAGRPQDHRQGQGHPDDASRPVGRAGLRNHAQDGDEREPPHRRCRPQPDHRIPHA